MTNNRAIFIILGTIITVSALFVNITTIIVGKFPHSLMMISMGILCFCMAYLAPHFSEKDERAQKIRERGIYISYFWGLGFALFLLLILNPISPLHFSGYEALSLYLSLYIATVFISMVYYARKY